MLSKFSSVPKKAQSADDSTAPNPRPKRHQVSRACVWCRSYRIKCDNNTPCRNCKIKGRDCVTESKDPVRTFPSAIKEIDQLKGRVKELEDQLKALQVQQHSPPDSIPSDETLTFRPEDVLPEAADPLSEGSKKSFSQDFVTREARPGFTQVYGSSSTFYFIHQLCSYLDETLQQSTSTSSDPLLSLNPSTEQDLHSVLTNRTSENIERKIVEQDLSRSQEEELLDIYWRDWHVLYPIVDKEEFKANYNKLWIEPNSPRSPSALVDIMLALSTQFNAAIKASESESVEPTDSTAGWWFFRRCHYFLQDDLECPQFSTFQSIYLTVMWLSRAAWHNTAHNVLAVGLGVGVTLGLHLEPSAKLPPEERKARKRLWWTMYAVDAQYALELGRPLGVKFGQVTCDLPREDVTAEDETSHTVPPSALSTEMIKLIMASRAIHIQFSRVCTQILGQSGQTDLFGDQKSLEECALWLERNMSYLSAWSDQVPHILKTPRENSGKPFSTDRSRLLLFPRGDALSRGRLILELMYHQRASCIYRMFIGFSNKDMKNAVITERHAISCANHAITMVQIIYQDITESDSLKAWQSSGTWQWNAALSLAGYIIAYPRGPATPAARKALSMAIAGYDILSTTFTNATGGAAVLRRLVEKIDRLLADDQLFILPDQAEDRIPSPTLDVTLHVIDQSILNNEENTQEHSIMNLDWPAPEFNLHEFGNTEDFSSYGSLGL